MNDLPNYHYPDAQGHFGPYGGSFASETLTQAIAELREAYAHYQNDPEFVAEFERELPNADVILLGPQVKYEAGRLTALAAPQGKAVAVIDMADYGMMRGAVVLDKALALLEH